MGAFERKAFYGGGGVFNLPNTVTRGVKWILAQGRIYVCWDPGPKVDWDPLKYTKKLRHLHSTWLNFIGV